MDLRTATSALIRDKSAASQLRLADSYIQSYNRMPRLFVLPAEHALLRPIIETFANNAEAFVEYLRALRDSAEGTTRDELHDLYRTVSVRVLQHARRTRLRRALAVVLPKITAATKDTITYQGEMRAIRVIEQAWGAMRMQTMSAERSAMSSKRLDTESRAILLAEFWKSIDSELEAGRVPLGDATIEDLVKAATT